MTKLGYAVINPNGTYDLRIMWNVDLTPEIYSSPDEARSAVKKKYSANPDYWEEWKIVEVLYREEENWIDV